MAGQGRQSAPCGKPGEVLRQHRVALVRHGREPFCFSEKNSSASSTSVRCRWRTAVASRSIEDATTASVAKYVAWRSRGMIWVDTGSTLKPMALATCSSTRGSTCAKVPTAPEIAQVATSLRAAASRPLRAREFGVGISELQADVVGSAWMPCERPTVGVNLCSKARRLSAASSASRSARRMSEACGSSTARQVSSTRRRSCRNAGSVHRDRYLGEMGQEGDDIVMDLRLDGVDAGDVELGGLALSRIFLAASGDDAEPAVSVAAWALISNQMRKRFRLPDRNHVGGGSSAGSRPLPRAPAPPRCGSRRYWLCSPRS